jgi:hypothetical protein
MKIFPRLGAEQFAQLRSWADMYVRHGFTTAQEGARRARRTPPSCGSPRPAG